MKTKKIKAVAALLLMSMLTSCSLSGSPKKDKKDKEDDDTPSPDVCITKVTCYSFLEDERLLSFDIADEGYLEIECDVDIGINSSTPIDASDEKLEAVLYEVTSGSLLSDPKVVCSDESTVVYNMQAMYRDDVSTFVANFCMDMTDIDQGDYALVIYDEYENILSTEEIEVVSREDADWFGYNSPQNPHSQDVAKPVIYLYPEEETVVTVGVDFDGEFTCTYPQISSDGTWTVTASPDGTIYDHGTGRYYDYLFWEGSTLGYISNFDHAICVPGSETAAFLEEYLAAAGLNDSEIDDFISYWLPKMEGNSYNLISFPIAEYEDAAQLDVSPAPDTVIRVYMVFTPLDEEIEISDDHSLEMPTPVERNGFTVVEWGGSEI